VNSEKQPAVCRVCREEAAVEEGLCAACLLRAYRAAQRLAKRAQLAPPAVPISEDGILTAEEVAARLRVDKSTVYRLIRAGELRAVKVGRRSLVRGSALDRFVVEHRTRRIA